MSDGTPQGIGDNFTLLTLTNSRGCSAWRQLTAQWAHARGWPYFELEGLSDVSQARSAVASWWLVNHTTPWALWLDDDMVIDLESVALFCREALNRASEVDLVAASYVFKRPASHSLTCLLANERVTLGRGGGYEKMLGCGFGLVAVKRSLFQRIALTLPRVRYEAVGCIGWPFFLGAIHDAPADPDGAKRHAGEDFAFCARALGVGGRLVCDTRLRIGHQGGYTYHWEDADQEVERVDRIDLNRTTRSQMKQG